MRTEGKRFGDYRVLGEIARGGQGAVVRAVRESDGHPVAIKLLIDRNPKRVARFRQEARVLAKLSHPNLLRVIEDGEHGGMPYMVMELVEGQELGDQAEGASPEEVVDWLSDVAGALQHCHEHGLVHRDVKPANIIIEAGSERPVLVDFGLIKRDPDKLSVGSLGVSRLSKTGELRGTPSYMAPEQINPGTYGEVSPLTDVYALGATLFAVLTGRPPFVADHLPGVLSAILGDAPPNPRSITPEVPAGLAQFCVRSLAKKPADRPASARAFASEMRDALHGPPPTRLPMILGAGLLALAGISLTVALVLASDGPAGTQGPAAPAQGATARTPSRPRPLSEREVRRGERELNRLKRTENPQSIVAEADEWLARYPGHPKAEEALALRRAASLRFPTRVFEGYRAWFLDDARMVGFRVGSHGGVLLRDLQGEEQRRWDVPWPITDLAVSPDRSVVAVGGWGKEILLIDVEREGIAARFPYQRETSCLQFSPDGSLLLVGGCELRAREGTRELSRSDFDARLIDPQTGELRVKLQTVRAEVKDVAFTRAGLLLARGTNIMDRVNNLTPTTELGNGIALHDLTSGAMLREEVMTTKVNFLDLHPDGRVLTGTNGGRVMLLEPSGEIVRHFTADDVSFNKTGPRFLVSAQSNSVRDGLFVDGGARFFTLGGESDPSLIGELSLWETATGERVRKVEFPASPKTLSLSPNGDWLLITENRRTTLWRAR